jgi:phosphoglycolate phosphatase
MTWAPPRAVLFDLDGTLTESLPGIEWSLNQGRRDLGLPPVAESDVRRWLGAGAAILAARSLGLEDVRDPRVVELTAVYLRHNEEGAWAHTRLYPGALEVLGELRRRGVKTAVTTNKPRANTDALLARLSLHN